jgi:hypothetical protein
MSRKSRAVKKSPRRIQQELAALPIAIDAFLKDLERNYIKLFAKTMMLDDRIADVISEKEVLALLATSAIWK